MKINRLLLAGATLSVVCLFAKVTTDYDHKANFANYHTYSWIGVNVQEPLWKDRIENAVDSQLTAKGWQKAPSNGDAAISAVGATHNEQTLTTFYDGPVWGGWFHRGWWGAGPGMASTTVDNTPVGTLHIDIFDGHTKNVIWHAEMSGSLSSKLEKNNKKLDEDVADAFKSFPPRDKD